MAGELGQGQFRGAGKVAVLGMRGYCSISPSKRTLGFWEDIWKNDGLEERIESQKGEEMMRQVTCSVRNEMDKRKRIVDHKSKYLRMSRYMCFDQASIDDTIREGG